jgi:hypothetical protein
MWLAALGEASVLVSGFGKWGGGVYDLTSGAPRALDDLPTSGLCVGGGRLWRVLRAPGEQTSACELLSYDARGVRSYQRYDAIRDPHDVRWFAGALHVSSSWENAVWRIDPGAAEPTLVWQGSTVPDAWHVNSLFAVGGALHVCAFGRFDRHKGWKRDGDDGTGFVRDLAAGRDVLTGLSRPHTPRFRGGRWYVCESARGALTELDVAGRVLRRAVVERFTRGLALAGPYALVGGNADRGRQESRGEVAVVDLRSFEVVERVPMPCLEVYEVALVGPGVLRGVEAGFGANAARAVEQHRGRSRPVEHQPTSLPVAVRLVTREAAARLAAMGQAVDRRAARRCGLRGVLPAAVVAGEVTTWRLELVNRTSGLLGTVPPRPVTVGARWFRLDDGEDVPAAGAEPVATNPQTPIERVVPPGMGTDVDVIVEAPAEPGRYHVRVALRQPGLGWFGARVQGEVLVKPDP